MLVTFLIRVIFFGGVVERKQACVAGKLRIHGCFFTIKPLTPYLYTIVHCHDWLEKSNHDLEGSFFLCDSAPQDYLQNLDPTSPKLPSSEISKALERLVLSCHFSPDWANLMDDFLYVLIEIFISCGTLPNTCFITRRSKDPEEARFFKRGNSAPLTATEQHLGLKSSHGTSKSFDINNLSTTMWNSLTNKNNIKRLSKMF